MSTRWSSRYWFLTYSQDIHLPKDESYEYFAKLHKNNTLDKCIIAHEVCPTTGKKHTHVVLCYSKRVDFTSPRHFDIGEHHPSIETIKSAAASERYLKKEDPEPFIKDNGKVTKMNVEIDRIWECKTIQEAVIGAKNIKDVPAIVAAYGLRPPPPVHRSVYEWRPWQADLAKDLSVDITDSIQRKVVWIYDYEGGSGKTALMKELWRQDSARYAFVTDVGTVKDFSTICQTYYDNGWFGGVMFFNLSRSKEDKTSVYPPLEAISDGVVTVTKYKGATIVFPLLIRAVVLANWPPIVNKNTLSMDRWDIRQIKKNNDGVLQCYREDALMHKDIGEGKKLPTNSLLEKK